MRLRPTSVTTVCRVGATTSAGAVSRSASSVCSGPSRLAWNATKRGTRPVAAAAASIERAIRSSAAGDGFDLSALAAAVRRPRWLAGRRITHMVSAGSTGSGSSAITGSAPTATSSSPQLRSCRAESASRTTMRRSRCSEPWASLRPRPPCTCPTPIPTAAIGQRRAAAHRREVWKGMFHGEVSDWINPPAIAIPSQSRSARRRDSHWLGLRCVTDPIPWSRLVRAESMLTATGSAPRARRAWTKHWRISSSPRLSEPNQPATAIRRVMARSAPTQLAAYVHWRCGPVCWAVPVRSPLPRGCSSVG